MFLNWWLKRAVSAKSKMNDRGEVILTHGYPIFMLGIICLLLALMVMVLGFTKAKIGSPGNELIWFVLIIGAFFPIGSMLILEGSLSKTIITDEGITVKTPRPGYPKYVSWKDIEEIRFSHIWNSFVFISQDNNKIYLLGYYYGIVSLVESIEKHLSLEQYIDAQNFIAEIHKIAQPGARVTDLPKSVSNKNNLQDD
jgi:hypothetical protein